MQTFKMSRSIYLWDWERWHGWSIWQIESFQLCPIGVWILPTLDWLYSTCWSLKALSLHKIERTCEIEKDDIIDPFDKLCPIGVWILPTLDWLYFTHWSLKALSVHKYERTCEIEKDYIIDPFNKSNPFNSVQLVSGYYNLGLVLSWRIVQWTMSILHVDC